MAVDCFLNNQFDNALAFSDQILYLTNAHEFSVYLHGYFLFATKDYVKVSFLIYGKNLSLKNEYFKFLIVSCLYNQESYS